MNNSNCYNLKIEDEESSTKLKRRSINAKKFGNFFDKIIERSRIRFVALGCGVAIDQLGSRFFAVIDDLASLNFA